MAFLAAGCGGTPPIRDPWVPGPNDLVLRTTTVGGIAGLGGPGTLPDVSVYGSGRVVARGDGGRVAGGARWPVEYRLIRAAYERLVAGAREAGLNTPRTIDDPHVADSFYALITFADPMRRTTRVIKSERGGAPAAFAARLDPKGWPAGDLSAGARPYRPAKVAVLAIRTPGRGSAWPFGPLGSGVRVAERTCTVLTGGNAARARTLPERAAWRYDGVTYQVAFRPLLPDESGCGALAR